MDEFATRLARIRASLEKIDMLLAELKNLPVHGESYNQFMDIPRFMDEPTKPVLRIVK